MSLHPSPIPAGGPVPNHFDWRQAWYPVQYLDNLDRQRPQPFTLLGHPLVIWWDPRAGRWSALDDRCPHRLVPLSEGRIAEDGLLECPYHGWGFTGEGRCDRLPQQPTDRPISPERSCVHAWPTTEAQGLLFVFAGSVDEAAATPLPLIEPVVEQPDGWLMMDIVRDLPYDAVTVLENVLDASHIPYTHHGTIGRRSNAVPMDLEIVASDRQGFKGLWAEGPRRGSLGPQHTTFTAPCLMWHDIDSPSLGRTITAVYATPTEPGRCRLFARFPFRFRSPIPRLVLSVMPRWWSHRNQNRILEDDQIFLHVQERELAARGRGEDYSRLCYLPTAADRYVLALRQWVRDYAGEPFPDQPLPPSPSREELLERWDSHTRICRVCREAEARLRRVRTVGRAIAALGLALGPLLAVLNSPWLPLSVGLTLVALVAVALSEVILPGFREGEAVPPRNRR